MAGWDKKGCEKIGLVKMDLLGLQTLDIIAECEALTGIKTQDISFDDEKTWRYLQNADHMLGIFQLSESKTKRYLREVSPKNIKDLSHINTAMRPGSDYKTFITNKRANKIKPEIDTEIIRETLKETYGALLYQDDLMFVISNTSSLNLGEADLLRRALEKNNKGEIEKYRSKYVETCKHPDKADEIFEWLKSKVGYAFAGAHAGSYSIIGYHTAYFKANYPHQFLIANIKHVRSSGKMTETETIAELIKEAKEMGISVKLPNFANAKLDPTYNSEAKAVFLGINSLRGVGIAASEVLEKAAAETNTMQEFYEYCNNAKVDTGRMKKDGSPIMRSLTNKTHFTTLVNIGFFGDSKQVMQEIIENKSIYGSIIDPEMLNKSEVELTNQALGFDFYSPFEAYRKTLPDQYQNNERYLILKVVELKSGQKNGRKWHMLKANSEIGQITCFLDSVSSIDKHDVLLAEYTRSKGDAINIRNYKLL
jgi:DNA polymerase III alpha subunit